MPGTHRFRPDGGLPILALVWAALWLPARAVEEVRWVEPNPPLGAVCSLAVAMGYGLGRTRFPSFLLHALAAGIIAVVVFAATSRLAEGATLQDVLLDIMARSGAALTAVRMGAAVADPLPFTALASTLTAVAAYLGSWLVFRRHHLWFGLLTGGTVLMAQLTWFPDGAAPYFIGYVLTGLLLVSMVTAVALADRAGRVGGAVPRHLGAAFLGGGAFLGVVATGAAFVLPVAGEPVPALAEWRLQEFNEAFARVFAPERTASAVGQAGAGKASLAEALNFGGNLPVGGPVHLSNDPVMRVSSRAPSYWRARAYETYTPAGWLSNTPVRTAPRLPPVPSILASQVSRETAAIRVEVLQRTNAIVSAGIPLETNANGLHFVVAPASYRINLFAPGADEGHPPDLRAALPELRAALPEISARLGNDGPAILGEIQALLPASLRAEGFSVGAGGRVVWIQAARAFTLPVDSLGIEALQVMPKGETYAVTGSLSTANAQELRSAGTEYPGWVLDNYLALPQELPESVRGLAAAWGHGIENAYDKAAAFERNLRAAYAYDLDVPAAPAGQDVTEHFLFELRRGYCTHFATALAVLLRADGIPARVVTGYTTGSSDGAGGYAVTEEQAHAWTEVFFPGYGWVEFEPTPSQPPLRAPDPAPGFEELPPDSAADLREERDEVLEAVPGEHDVPSGLFAILRSMEELPLLPVAGAAAVLLGLRVAWLVTLPGLNPAAGSYQKLSRLAVLKGRGPRTTETPSEFARRISDEVPTAGHAVRGLGTAYARYRFGPGRPTVLLQREAERHWRSARGPLWRWVLRGR